MLLFSSPRCDYLIVGAASKQTAFTSRCLTLPLWHARPASHLLALRSLQANLTLHSRPQPSTHKQQKVQQTLPTPAMSSPRDFYVGSPRSPAFSPTLGSIPEVFEYDDLATLATTPEPTTPLSEHTKELGFVNHRSTTALPCLSVQTSPAGIILSPRRATSARPSIKVTGVLRKVLEADRLRRRRALRIYLKVIVFMKMLLESHERYNSLIATSGMHMPR
jgi:hypothetical protein